LIYYNVDVFGAPGGLPLRRKNNNAAGHGLPKRVPIEEPDVSTFPQVLPPRTVVRVMPAGRSNPWRSQLGRLYRIGYYSPWDGLLWVRLVDDRGDYVDTALQFDMPRYFRIERLSDERDFFGEHRRRLGSRRRSKELDGP